MLRLYTKEMGAYKTFEKMANFIHSGGLILIAAKSPKHAEQIATENISRYKLDYFGEAKLIKDAHYNGKPGIIKSAYFSLF